MGYQEEAIQHMLEVRRRLRTPPNAVVDTGINLKSRSMTHIQGFCQEERVESGKVIHREIFSLNPKVSLPVIIEIVESYYNLPPGSIIGNSKKYHIAHARHVAVWVALTTLVVQGSPISSTNLGRMLGKDHTTILNSRIRIRKILDNGDDDSYRLAKSLSVIRLLLNERANPACSFTPVRQPDLALGSEQKDWEDKCLQIASLYSLDKGSGSFVDGATEGIPEAVQGLQSVDSAEETEWGIVPGPGQFP